MAEKLPVFRTVGRAYKFLFTRFFSVLGVTWVPLAGVLAAALWLQILMEKIVAGENQFILPLIATWIFYIISGSILIMAPMRVYFKEPYGRFVHFRFGMPELRFWLYNIFLSICIMMFALACFVIGGAILYITTILFGLSWPTLADLLSNPDQFMQKLPQIGVITIALLFLVLYGAFIFITLRLLPSIATIVAEKRVGLIRTWKMTKGNIWRFIGGILLLMFSFYILIGFLFGFAVSTAIEMKLFSNMGPISLPQSARIPEGSSDIISGPPDIMAILSDLPGIILIGIVLAFFVFMTLLNTIFHGFIGASYEGLAGATKDNE